jgi:DNA polymerase-4
VSIDEAFLDLTGSEKLLGDGKAVARQIKQRVQSELELTISVGVAPNKFLAKLASDLQKPDGLTVILSDDVDRVLSPLPIGKIWGVGPKTAGKLNDLGIHTIGDIRKLPLKLLIDRFGSEGARYHHLAHGIDDRPVTPDSQAKSIGQEHTFEVDIDDADELRAILLSEVEHVAGRLRRHGLRARGVTLKIRDGQFNTITRAAKLEEESDVTQVLWECARGTFDQWAGEAFKPLRLLGVQATHLSSDAEQLPLFEDQDTLRQRRVDAALDKINTRLGRRAIRRGGGMKAE